MIGWIHILLLVALLGPAVLALQGVDYGEPSLKRGLTQKEKQHILDLHNKYREVTAKGQFYNKPQAANMMKMHWDKTAARHAQEWADNCDGPAHGNHPNEGQNYAAAMPASYVFKSGFKGWNDNEAKNWVWTASSGSGTDYFPSFGHYSQVVWAKSTGVGCGFNSCPGRMARFICNFSPPGNYMGEAPYVIGAPCSKCPSGTSCVNGALCAAGGSGSKPKPKPKPQKPEPKEPEEKPAPKPKKRGCKDKFSNCEDYKDFCASNSFKTMCPSTCNAC